MVVNLTVILLSLLINRGNLERLNIFFPTDNHFVFQWFFFLGILFDVTLQDFWAQIAVISHVKSRTLLHHVTVPVFDYKLRPFWAWFAVISDVRVTYYCIMLLLLHPPTVRNTGSRFPELWLRVRVPSSTQKRCVWVVYESGFIIW